MRLSRAALARAQRDAIRLGRKISTDPAAAADAFLAEVFREQGWDEPAIEAFLARPLNPMGPAPKGSELDAEIERLLAEISSLPPDNE